MNTDGRDDFSLSLKKTEIFLRLFARRSPKIGGCRALTLKADFEFIAAVFRKSFLFLVAGFCLGLAIAFAVRKTGANGESPIESPQKNAMEPVRMRSKTQKAADFLKCWNDAEEDSRKRDELLVDFPAEAIPDVLAELRKKTSMLKWPNPNDIQLLEKLVNDWYDRNPNAVLAWLRTLSDFDQKHLLCSLMEKVGKTDFDASVDFLRARENADLKGTSASLSENADERSIYLYNLYGFAWNGRVKNKKKVCEILLERMHPQQRTEALQNFGQVKDET